MMFNFLVTKHWPVFLLLASCGRNLQSFETVEAVERLSGGLLCAQAHVSLANKDELQDSFQKDNLQFIISAPASCLDSFSKSLFSDTELHSCSIDTGNACTKKINGDMLSIYRLSYDKIEMNTWS